MSTTMRTFAPPHADCTTDEDGVKTCKWTMSPAPGTVFLLLIIIGSVICCLVIAGIIVAAVLMTRKPAQPVIIQSNSASAPRKRRSRDSRMSGRSGRSSLKSGGEVDPGVGA